MNPVDQFQQERLSRVHAYGSDIAFQALSRDWLR